MEKISLSQWLIYELVDKVDELTEEELEANLDNLPGICLRVKT